MLTAEQIRAGRALVRMDQRKLAESAGVSIETIKRLEAMKGRLTKVRVETVDAIQAALEAAGVGFDPRAVKGPGVWLKGK